ncbi:MAG: V/A-type H+-transporting ATPase subunit A [Oleiphilaceae bacterium]
MKIFRGMTQVTDEERVSNEDYVTQQKGALVDMVYLQQEVFDLLDVLTSIERQQESIKLLIKIINREITLNTKPKIREWFNRMTDCYRNLNYSTFQSDSYVEYMLQVDKLLRDAS